MSKSRDGKNEQDKRQRNIRSRSRERQGDIIDNSRSKSSDTVDTMSAAETKEQQEQPVLWIRIFCILDILYGGLGIGKLQFLIKKNLLFFSAVIFFQFLVIKALDPYWIRIRNPDPYRSPTANSGSGSGKKEYGSTTLSRAEPKEYHEQCRAKGTP